MNRPGLKFSCILVSVLIWLVVANTSNIEQTVNLPIKVSGLGEGQTTAGSQDLHEKIQVKLTGTKLKLLAHQYFNRNIGNVVINLTGLADTTVSIALNRTHIQLSENMSNPVIQRMKNITITTDRQVSRKLPVIMAREGSLPPELDFVVPPELKPDSVLVTGPSRFFGNDMTLKTEMVDLAGISGNSEISAKLLSLGEFLIPEISEIRIAILLGRLETRILANIPVVPLVDAGRPDVGISPPVADVTVEGLADSILVLTRDRISVVVSTDTLDVGIHHRSGQVVCPDWVVFSRSDPPAFQVIVGNPPELRVESPEGLNEEERGE